MFRLRGKALVYLVTVVSSTGFCLFGYDNGLMGQIISEPGFLDIIGNPNAAVQGFVVSSYDVGCMLGALAAVLIGEQIGRKRTILLACIVHVIGDAVNATSFSLAQVLVSRIILGVGLGLFTSASPVWLAETATAEMRAVMVAIQLTCLIIGTNIAYWFDYGLGFTQGEVKWRLPFAFQAAFPIVAFGFAIGLPESPRWLASHGMTDAATTALSALRDLPEDHELVQAELHDITSAIALESESTSWGALFQARPQQGSHKSDNCLRCPVDAVLQRHQFCGILFPVYSQKLRWAEHEPGRSHLRFLPSVVSPILSPHLVHHQQTRKTATVLSWQHRHGLLHDRRLHHPLEGHSSL